MLKNSHRDIVALCKCPAYELPALQQAVYKVLDAANLCITPGLRVLVKPNLLMAKDLACTNPQVVSSVCSWLLEKGAYVFVGDSPGFGRAAQVARAIGLDAALEPLGLHITGLDKPVKVMLPLKLNGVPVSLNISRRALECDIVFSVAKIKAHKQMRITLCVKNCFGCVTGLAKALAHARYGQTTEFFAQCLAALWSVLPPVAGFADGVISMHMTGPANGEPYASGLLGASFSAVALDSALLQVLGIAAETVPLAQALDAYESVHQQIVEYPLEKPEAFDTRGFIVPHTLAPASFHPARLIKSCARRIWNACMG